MTNEQPDAKTRSDEMWRRIAYHEFLFESHRILNQERNRTTAPESLEETVETTTPYRSVQNKKKGKG